MPHVELDTIPIKSYEPSVSSETLRYKALHFWQQFSPFIGISPDQEVAIRSITLHADKPKNIYQKLAKLQATIGRGVATYHDIFHTVNISDARWWEINLTHELGHAALRTIVSDINRPQNIINEGIANLATETDGILSEHGSIDEYRRKFHEDKEKQRYIRKMTLNRMIYPETGKDVIMKPNWENIKHPANKTRLATLFLYLLSTQDMAKFHALLRSSHILSKSGTIRASFERIYGRSFQQLLVECVDWLCETECNEGNQLLK